MGVISTRAPGAAAFSPPRRLGSTQNAAPSFEIVPYAGPGESHLFFLQADRLLLAGSREGFWSPQTLAEGAPRVQSLSAVGTSTEQGYFVCWEERDSDGARRIAYVHNPESGLPERRLWTADGHMPAVLSADPPRVLWHGRVDQLVTVFDQEVGAPPRTVARGHVVASRSDPALGAACVVWRDNAMIVMRERWGEWDTLSPALEATTYAAADLLFSGEHLYAAASCPWGVRVFLDAGGVLQNVGAVHAAAAPFALAAIGKGPCLVFAEAGVVHAAALEPGGLGTPAPILTTDDPVATLRVMTDREGFTHLVAKAGDALWYATTTPPPTAGFTLSPREGAPPLEVAFTATGAGIITSHFWDFGDGSQSAQSHPVHVYREPGAYTVTLRLTGPGGMAEHTVESAVLVRSPGCSLRLPRLKALPAAGEIWHPVLAAFPTPIRGYQTAVAFPPGALVEDPVPEFTHSATASMRPEFVSVRHEQRDDERAVLLAVIFDAQPPFDGRVLHPLPPPGGERVLLYLRYTPKADLTGMIPLRFTNAFGSPPMRNIFTNAQAHSLVPLTADGALEIVPGAGRAVFIRGDANGDGECDLADAIFLLAYIFAGGAPPHPCIDAGDVNDSGEVDVADPIALLAFLFAGGAPPVHPFPHAGIDPTPAAPPPAQ